MIAHGVFKNTVFFSPNHHLKNHHLKQKKLKNKNIYVYIEMPNEWIIALKKWNTGKETWCLPRKGSKAYDEVRELMPKKLKASAPPEKAPEPESKPMSVPKKGPKIAPKKPIKEHVAPMAPPMKIPMESQRKAFSDSMAPKVKFVEPAKKAEAKKEVVKLSKEGEAIQSFGHFIWRRFDGGEIKGKNYRQTAGGKFPMYAFDLLDVKGAWSSYWDEWNPIIGLKIPGTGGKAIATCQTDGTVSFTNIMSEEKTTKQAIDRVIVEEFREYGAGDLEPRYKKISNALTTMKVINRGKKS